MSFKAVIFDLDGTLLDTLSDLGESMNNVLKRHGFPDHNLESYKYMIGDGVEVLVKRALPETVKKTETIGHFVSEYRSEYEKNWNRKTRPYDGIIELINSLHSIKMRLAILSNKPHDFTELCVREFLPFEKFHIILGVKPGKKPKPDPHGAIEIAAGLKMPPERILYVGDTSIDMKTAVSAGMYPVGVLWGFRTRDELYDNGAKILIEKPQDLLRLLE